jgi:VIT1/CCC1 family predicted Fe2+/Mn2+ transporter
MKDSTIKGLSFGLTSGIITTLGMMVGLNAGTGSKIAVLGGILTIAIADAFSDALGIHISEEAEDHKSHREVWRATIATFLAKLFFALTFLVPILLFSLTTAVWVSIAWGLSILAVISYLMARERRTSPSRVIFEHLLIAVVVIVITKLLGDFIAVNLN